MRKEITFANFLIGDTIIAPTGSKCKVLATAGIIFARSNWDIALNTFQEWISITDAMKMGWKFLQPEEAWPITMEELEREYGRKLKIIKK